MKNPFNIVMIILVVVALVFGYFIFQKYVSPRGEDLVAPSLIEISDFSLGEEEALVVEQESTIFIGPNTQIFGIAEENPYYGEPPASIGIGIEADETESKFFEIWGDVVFIDPNDNVIRLSTDGARPINTTFSPRGPRVSLEDIKVGDRIVASSSYNKDGDVDYNSMQFIQISPSIEEIKATREAQGK